MKITQSKSQISIEFLLVMGILVLILVTMLFFSAVMQKQTNKAKESFDLTKECFRLGRFISSVYVSGDGTEVRTKTNNLITIFNTSFIDVKNLEEGGSSALCTFYAKANSSQVTGKLTIKNEDGLVIVSNGTS